MAIKGIKVLLNIFATIILFLFIVIMLSPANSPNIGDNIGNTIPNTLQSIKPFSLRSNDITHDTKTDPIIPRIQTSDVGMSDVIRAEVLSRAKAMTEVKWTPKYNLSAKECLYIFIKGKTYSGIPYSMGSYQAVSPKDFLSKINNSKILYGNDCSGFVSAAWEISRQTTLTFFNAVKDGSKIDGKSICQISWDDLRQADALLLDNGKGKGHIMLYIDSDKKNSDNLNVYEQNVSTVIPFVPVPTARKDVRSKSKLIKSGYIPIRLI